MPIWRNSPSMPKVRASSGTIGTMLRPMFLSLSRMVRDHLALTALAEAEALDGLREDHGRLSLVAHRGGVGRIDLARVVAAAIQPPDLLVGHVGDHRLELGVLAEEMLARVGPALGLEVLVLAVDALLHHPAQQALM